MRACPRAESSPPSNRHLETLLQQIGCTLFAAENLLHDNNEDAHMQVSPIQQVDHTMVLGQAVQRVAIGLGLTGRTVAQTVGYSEATVSRIWQGERGIDPNSKEGQLALMLVRVFRSLDALVGGDDAKRQTWMHTHNSALVGVPATLILTPEGLGRTLAYLDGMRAPN